MGLMDQVTGALGGARGGGIKAILMQQLIAYLSKPGALGSLTSAFQQQGLGHILQSWVGTGNNLPIAAGQVKQVLPRDVLGGMARQANVSEDQAAAEMSGLLPQVIDRISPDGKEPSSNDLGGLLASVGKLFG